MTDDLFYRFCIFLLFAFVIPTCICLNYICLNYKKRISRLEEKVNFISYTQFVTRKEKLDFSSNELENVLNSVINRDDG